MAKMVTYCQWCVEMICHVSDLITVTVLSGQLDGPDCDIDFEDSVMMQVYGQGMTVSAVEAEALHNLLKVTQLLSFMPEQPHVGVLYFPPESPFQIHLGTVRTECVGFSAAT